MKTPKLKKLKKPDNALNDNPFIFIAPIVLEFKKFKFISKISPPVTCPSTTPH